MAIAIRCKVLCTISLVMFLLCGCGEKTVTSSASNKLEESQNCIDCHSAHPSIVLGKFITEEWKLSAHNTNNKAGCADCHEFDPSHEQNNSCTGCHQSYSHAYRIKNPDSAGKCAKCHTSAAGFRISTYNGIDENTLTNHFSTPTLAAYTSGTYKARYVTKNYENNCRSCHNPHDTTSQINVLRQWARSGKGDVSAKPWSDRNFRTSGTPLPATAATSFGTDCVRCHTSTGHINFMADKSIAAVGGTSKTEGKEVLACNVCHIDYSYTRRTVGAVTAFYNKSTVGKMRIRITEAYPNIGESNICLNCHVGRETGEIIKELADLTLTANKVIAPLLVADPKRYNFNNVSFENSHYLSAGATLFSRSGYEFLSLDYADSPLHRSIGGTSSGPCITCHMNPGNHTFLPVVKDTGGNITALANSATCNTASCHNGVDVAVMSVTELEHVKEQYNAAMEALKTMISSALNMHFYEASPYFYTAPYTVGYNEQTLHLCTNNLAVKNWQTGGTSTFTPKYTASSNSWSCTSIANVAGTAATGPNNMGAAFNYNLLHHDFGAFAHNRLYAKRLIYDSISWLYDNDIATTTNAGGYSSDVEAAIQASALTAQQKADACNYLFNRAGYTYASMSSDNWRPGSLVATY